MDIKTKYDWGDYLLVIDKCANPEAGLRRAGVAIANQLKSNFYKGIDPNTKQAWYPLGTQALQARGRTGILNVKGSIAHGFGSSVQGRQLTVHNASAVGSYHQDGSRYIRARRFMPEAPTEEITEVIEKEFS